MPISPKSLVTLEYDKVIDRLTRHCSTERGRALAAVLVPATEYEDVLHLQQLTAEARRLVELKPSVSLQGVRDIAKIVRQASIDKILEPAQLLDVQATLDAARVTHETIDKLRVYLPLVGKIADRIADFRDVSEAIGKAINGKGEIVDSASPVLATLRRESRVVHDRLRARIEQIVNSGAKSALQDPIITLRDGRYVVPVKAELRSQLPGIVHDVSSSGATVFLEPLETVEMGNKWREMLAEEEREIARILRDLSVCVGNRADEIAAALDALAEIDLLIAKARLGEAMKARHLPFDPEGSGARQPWLLEEPGSLYLRNARHPLLTGEVVPVTAWLGDGNPQGMSVGTMDDEEGFSVMLITGPNTGGKTVALKTVGLLALMAQAGLAVPADADSRLPIFDDVFADIGDEQSIEQSLSTFSSHIGNIIDVLRRVTHRSLVLLDELAAGTDPVEGAALAKAILTYLLKVGALTIATTHHGELKAFAHTTPGVANASVEFDAESLAPTYRLRVGLPGQSNALSIAQRLGMPEAVLADAREGIDPDRLAVETLISDLHRHRDEAETASETQRAAAIEAERARDRVTKELQSLEANRNKLIEQTRKEMETELQQTRARLRDAIKQLEKAERLTVFERAHAVEAVQEEIAVAETSVKKVQRRERKRRRGPLPEIEPGDRVYLVDVPTPGDALTSPDESGEFDLMLGALRARVQLKQVADVEKQAGEEEQREQRPAAAFTPPMIAPELDLRGLTVDEALILVDQRLDEAARAGVPEVRIIHGKGTGALRTAVRGLLRKHVHVRGQAPAERQGGGDGVTIVELAV